MRGTSGGVRGALWGCIVLLCAAALLGLAACSGGDGGSNDGDGNGGDDASARDASATAPGVDGLVFTDVSEQAGFTEVHSELGLLGEQDMTSGAAVADVDGDGHLDVFLTRVGRPNSLYRNNGDGTFTDIAREAGVAGPSDRFGSSAAVFFDIDGDGHLDLFVTGAGGGANELFVNDGTGTFTEQSAQRGLSWPPPGEGRDAHQYGASVADVNGDGHLDLLVLHWYADLYNGEAVQAAGAALGWDETYAPGPCETAAGLAEVGFPVPEGTPPNRSALLLNDGTGNFTDATADYDLPLDEIVAFTGSFVDLDGDGWLDLAITGDGCTSRLFRNDGGERFVDVTDTAGVGTDENGMGSVIRDVDGDGRADWFITSVAHPDGDDCQGGGFFGCSGNRLFLNRSAPGELSFVDATDDYALRDGGWGWGAAIEDLSNDGQLEVVMVNGYDIGQRGGFHEPFIEDTTRVWVLDGDGATEYRDVATAVGIDDTTIGHAVVAFDYDDDGDLDLLVVPSGNQTPRLYRNDSPPRGWLAISLTDPATPGNTWGDGARIEITPDDGADPIVGWISTNGSYESQIPPRFHTGWGDRTEALHRIEVHWPHDDTPQVLSDVELRQRIVVERPG